MPDALGLVDKWLLDMREMARRSEIGAAHCCRVFDLDSWWQTLLEVQCLGPQILKVIEVLTYSQNKDFNRALSKYKIVEVLEMCSSKQTGVNDCVRRVVYSCLNNTEYESLYSSFRLKLIENTTLMTTIVTRHDRLTLEILIDMLQVEKMRTEIMWQLVFVYDLLE